MKAQIQNDEKQQRHEDMIYTSVRKTMRAEETVRKRYTDAQVKSM
jgi:hypothetical protein